MIAKNYKAYQEQVQTCPIFKLDIQQFSENSFKDTTVPSISFPLEQYSFPFGHKYVYFQPGKHFTQVLKHAYELNIRSIFQKEKNCMFCDRVRIFLPEIQLIIIELKQATQDSKTQLVLVLDCHQYKTNLIKFELDNF